jgi:hypothetical protein
MTDRKFSADAQPTGPRCAQCGRLLSAEDRATQVGQFNCCGECRKRPSATETAEDVWARLDVWEQR